MPVVYLIIGWVFGILSTFIFRYLDKRSKISNFKKGLFTELRETQITLANYTCLFYEDIGEINKGILSWVYSIFLENKDNLTEEENNLFSVIKKLLQFSDKTLERAEIYTQLKSLAGKRKFPKKIYIPFLSLNINNLPLLKKDLQIEIAGIYRMVNCLNEEIDNWKYFFNKTFEPNLSTDNYSIVKSNLKNCSEHIAIQSKLIADAISKVKKELI